MANVVTQIPTGIHIVFDGTTDIDFATYYPNGIMWTGLEIAGNPGDKVIIRSKVAAGVPIATIAADALGIGSVQWDANFVFPYILATDLSIADVTKAYLIVRYA